MATSTISGGVRHGASVLSHGERSAAQNVLSKLNRSAGLAGSHPAGSSSSATVFGGVKAPALASSTLLHGSDTFIGGVRSATTHALANIGNDTVVSGSASHSIRSLAENHTSNAPHSFTLNSDTISVKGATADTIKNQHPQAAAGAHTMTLSDKTTVTIAGLTKHDIGKLPH